MPTTLASLLTGVKRRLSNIQVSIRDEDLSNTTALPATVFQSRHKNWRSFPVPQVRKIDSLGVETTLFSADYVIDATNGKVTLTVATSDVVRVTYDFDPFTDAELTEELEPARKEIATGVYRTIDPTDVADPYVEAITKRVYTNVLKRLVIEAKDYFSVSIAGRSMDKNTIVDHFTKIIETNEEQLASQMNSLRYYNTSSRLE